MKEHGNKVKALIRNLKKLKSECKSPKLNRPDLIEKFDKAIKALKEEHAPDSTKECPELNEALNAFEDALYKNISNLIQSND